MYKGASQWQEFRQPGIGILLAPQVYGDVLESRLNLEGLTMVRPVSPYEGAASKACSLVTRDSAESWEPAFSWWGDKKSDDSRRRGHIHWQRTGTRWRVLSDPWILLMLAELERRQAAMLSQLKASELVSKVEARVEARVKARVKASHAGRRWKIAREPAAVGKAAVYGLHTLEDMRLVELYMLSDWVKEYGRERKKGDVKIGERELEQLKGLPKRSRNQSVEGKLVVRGEMLADFLAKLTLETERHG